MRKEMVGLAAEFAVASKLCRRDIYAQLTLGHLKRTDLLILSEEDELLRIEVKGKQGRDWPNCKDIYGHNVMLVLVDFAGKSEPERPDFYILTVEDWRELVKGEIEKARAKDVRIELDERNVLSVTPETASSQMQTLKTVDWRENSLYNDYRGQAIDETVV